MAWHIGERSRCLPVVLCAHRCSVHACAAPPPCTNGQVLRILFGCFPTYRNSPLRPAFDRVLQVGDARCGSRGGLRLCTRFWGFSRTRGSLSQGVVESGRVPSGGGRARAPGCRVLPAFTTSAALNAAHRRLCCSGIQSPLSFGGFGALTRHLGRLTGAISEALEVDALDRGSLGWINAYNPGGWAGSSHSYPTRGRQPAQAGMRRALPAWAGIMHAEGKDRWRPGSTAVGG